MAANRTGAALFVILIFLHILNLSSIRYVVVGKSFQAGRLLVLETCLLFSRGMTVQHHVYAAENQTLVVVNIVKIHETNNTEISRWEHLSPTSLHCVCSYMCCLFPLDLSSQ